MINQFNTLIELLKTGFARLFELPLISLLAGGAVFFLAAAAITLLIWKRFFPQLDVNLRKKCLLWAAACYFAALTVLLVDHQMYKIVKEFGEVRGQVMLVSPEVPADEMVPMTKKIRAALHDVRVMIDREAPGVQYIGIRRSGSKPFQLHLAVIDLTTPGLQIEINREKLAKKTFTTSFAEQYNCVVAINGEAGVSPADGVPLGRWTGNWIAQGKPVLLADSADRPFLSFDRENKARYYRAEIVDTAVAEEKFNTIWGRFDLLVDGKAVMDTETDDTADVLYPRTIMGIDRAGGQLFLLVADGRQSGYSLGLKLADAARLLAAIGAYNAMSCDQGGSSCMYLKTRNGLVNGPSDGHERPVYSHFGISLKKAPKSPDGSAHAAQDE